MSTKFQSQDAEDLYSLAEPNDQVGSSSDGVGWAGLYLEDGEPGGKILVENNDGFVDLHVYSSEAELKSAWIEMEKTLDIRTPEEDDWVISEPAQGQTRVYQVGGKPIHAGFDQRDDAIDWIKLRMEEDHFWPDVWVQNERGDMLRIDITD